MAKKEDKPAKKNDKGKAKDKKGKKGNGDAGEAAAALSVVAHPRAAAQVRRAKGAGGVGGFAIAAYVGSKAGIPPDQIGERALGAGVVGYLLAWGCSVTVWRHLMLAELKARYEHVLAQQQASRPPMIGAEAAAEKPAG